ncbi:MAG: GNAT family protein [Actinomyces urogenitalis]|uniref:GNAT family N-acetyltransferase n=1 Tax=Actinomyces urogenitalis TaxID=103621 RepID=UPI002A7EF5C0|nr:GNAT family protein [Actinomyces urogenitalis]MDY3679692.1 GNAT family protein [Actinomyces urogenitalis]
MTTIFTHKPVLEGELVRLRPITVEDARIIDHFLRTEPDIARLTGSVHSSSEDPHTMSWEEVRAVYEQWMVDDTRLVLAIVDLATNAVVGEAVLNQWDENNRSCNFRILMGQAGRGRGLGTEATQLITDYGLSLGLHRISLDVFDFNPAARRAYEKAGFVYEGTLRHALYFDGAWVDSHLMARLGD